MIEQRFDGYPCWKLIVYRFKVDKNRLKEYAWQNGLTDDRTLATIFAQDYGPWKAGHVAERLVWDYTGYLIETDIDGRLLKRC
ncbi:hypothetical protein, partial [Streptomyces turgidiscabies]|uniref:hypothetical protein n=1 Tax=Streptomyces turgidiscabies TaxID=85558 RepID=UPI0038F64629